MAALISLFVFVMGNGVFSTYLTSELTRRHESSLLIGLMTTCFYAGLVVGSFKIERIIARVAHIRAYAAFASIITVISLLHGLFFNIYFWLLLRLIAGVATAGIFIVIESWLLCQSTMKTRGQVLSLYMVTFYASQGLGQLLLKVPHSNALEMFSLIAMSSSLSVFPLAMTKAAVPIFAEPSTLKMRSLFKKCASGVIGCFAGGAILGTIYGLFPVFLLKEFGNASAVANYMSILILGGMALQYPIGKVSDVIERRIVLVGVSLGCLFTSVLMMAFTNQAMAFAILCGILGGFVFTIYPVSISHACDSLDAKDIVAGTQTLLLTYSIGAMIGPLISPIFMRLNSKGIFIYFIIVATLLSVLLMWRKTVKSNIEQEEAYITYPQNTPVSSEVDPRGELAQ